MDSRCTCGCLLPVAASFCPGCGRPLIPGIGEPTVAADSIPTPLTATDEPAGPGKDAYLRAAFLPALGATLVRFVFGALSPLLALLSFLAPGCAGYFAVRLFEKRTPPVNSRWRGCGVGVLTGLLCFVPSFLFQLSTVAVYGRERFLEVVRERTEDLPVATEMLRILEEPGVFTMVIVLGLLIEGLSLLVASGTGGVLAVVFRQQPAGRQ